MVSSLHSPQLSKELDPPHIPAQSLTQSLEASASHVPQLSKTAVPPQKPSQSFSRQEKSSSVAKVLKLHAKGSVHPKTSNGSQTPSPSESETHDPSQL